MTFRNLFLLAAVAGGVTQPSAFPQLAPPPPDSNSALTALGILPPPYQGDIVKLSADNGDPDPPQWYVLAYRDSPDGGLFSIVIAHGEIVQEKPSLNLGELFKNPSPIAVERMTIDSPAAFDIAQQFAEANGKNLGTVSYVLQQTGGDSAPVWQVWCYDRGGRYFGYLQIAATNGTVISTDGLPRAP
ncbi:MAG: hypothetical protein WCA06_14340 [Terrimicrobiaceae bacterium]